MSRQLLTMKARILCLGETAPVYKDSLLQRRAVQPIRTNPLFGDVPVAVSSC